MRRRLVALITLGLPVMAMALAACGGAPAGPLRYATAHPEAVHTFHDFDLARCQAACPAAGAREQVMDCYPASIEARRKIMSEFVADTALVCVYQPAGGR